MQASLKYLADLPLYDEEKPYTLYGFPDEVTPKTNCEFTIIEDVPVHDVRGHESDFKINEHGFEFRHKPSYCDLRPEVFERPDRRERVWQYLQETISIAKDTLGASKVLCFDWRVRKFATPIMVVELSLAKVSKIWSVLWYQRSIGRSRECPLQGSSSSIAHALRFASTSRGLVAMKLIASKTTLIRVVLRL
jgi:hypothetical protein